MQFYVVGFLASGNSFWVKILGIILIIGFGAFYVLQGTAGIIEETTEVLSERTKIAGGVLQSVGTAFPDMVLGIVAAVISLRLRDSDYAAAINFAIIAAATTFGSNIYNIGYAIWCVFRQNSANRLGHPINIFPFLKKGGTVKPMSQHINLPAMEEIDISMDVINALTLLTMVVAVSMVIFGRIANPPAGITGDLYQLVRPIGLLILVLTIVIIFRFRKTKREKSPVPEIENEERYYEHKSGVTIWLHLLISGGAILLAAEAMVTAVETFSVITGLPFVISGVLTGVVGCLGEILVIHDYTTNPKGRIGDALVGIGMDNVVTIMGAAIVALIGGIFLGGNALILIFVLILTLNSVLMWQISKLKNYINPGFPK